MTLLLIHSKPSINQSFTNNCPVVQRTIIGLVRLCVHGQENHLCQVVKAFCYLYTNCVGQQQQQQCDNTLKLNTTKFQRWYLYSENVLLRSSNSKWTPSSGFREILRRFVRITSLWPDFAMLKLHPATFRWDNVNGKFDGKYVTSRRMNLFF